MYKSNQQIDNYIRNGIFSFPVKIALKNSFNKKSPFKSQFESKTYAYFVSLLYTIIYFRLTQKELQKIYISIKCKFGSSPYI